MRRITIAILVCAALAGCYPPSYYDTWNRGSVERYLAQDVYSPDYDTYYRPYYSWYPSFFFPFSLSFSYSLLSYDGRYHWYPRHGYFDGGRQHYYLKYGGRR